MDRAVRFERVLVTGGAGYVGHVLIPALLNDGYEITLYDTLYFGSALEPHPNLTVIQADIRDAARFAEAVQGIDAVIHLACISNDASFELDEKLSTTINFETFETLVTASKAAGVKRFIYASTSSVYGVSDVPDITEEHPLVPLTLYNKFKGMCEPVLFQHQSDDFVCTVIRPATVCGYSPRCRLDVSVNILTNHAVNRSEITVFGGAQKRPNLHIKDMVDAYRVFLDAPDEKVAGEIFNCGYQNLTIMEITEMVKRVVEHEFPEKTPIGIKVKSTNDNRSYHINSDKITRVLGFLPQHKIEDAVRDLCTAFREGRLPDSLDDERYFNVKKLKSMQVT
ncbi:SDR family oxidoreductase [Alphaproteobacteria bacterium]|nr:SDR family oxidoreductase [Alphaproteobacteria bacterium]